MAEALPMTPVRASQPSFRDELTDGWQRMPQKGMFLALLCSWLALFWLLGNPTLGYANSPSIYAWLGWMYEKSTDDSHGPLIPFVVLILFWLKRKELLEVAKQPWWPGVILLTLALLLHVLGYTIQQPQVCAVAFFAGIYALMGITWGFRWLKASLFPFLLFAFAVPTGNVLVPIALRLRVCATTITAELCRGVLGIDVLQQGTSIMDSLGQYQYEVAAACSGLRSLTAMTVITLIYSFMGFERSWQRIVMIASAVPLAVLSNVVRLSSIIVAAEAFGQKAGNWVHHSWWVSLLPYVPAVVGMLLIGRLISRQWTARKTEAAGCLPARQIPTES